MMKRKSVAQGRASQARMSMASVATTGTRRASFESTISGKSTATMRGAVGRLKKAKKNVEAGLLFQEEMERVRVCYEAELFASREASMKDARHLADAMDIVAEKTTLLKKAERNLCLSEQAAKETRLLAKRNENSLHEKLISAAQAHRTLEMNHETLQSEYATLQSQVEALVDHIKQRDVNIEELQTVVRTNEHDAIEVQDSLKKAICIARRENVDLKLEHVKQEKELKAKLDALEKDLSTVIDSVEAALCGVEEKASAANICSVSMDLLVIQYKSLLAGCRLKASRFTSELLSVSSLHTNLSPTIREILLQKSPEALVSLVDTLSFEANVRQYLEALYPCANQPFPHTPSAALMTRPQSAPCKVVGTTAQTRQLVASVTSLLEGKKKKKSIRVA